MHVRKKTLRPLHKCRGAGIVDVMVGLAITGMLITSAAVWQKTSDAQNEGRSDADSLSDFQQLAGNYYLANRPSFQAALGGDATQIATFCRINVAADGSGGSTVSNATKRTCAFDATLLRAVGVWPSGKSVDANGGRWVFAVRQIMSTDATPVPTGNEEALVLMAARDTTGNVMTSGSAPFTGDASRITDSVKSGMDALGGTGGFVPPGKDLGRCQYNATTKQVCGISWSVSLDDFIN